MTEKIRELFHSKMTKISDVAAEKTENLQISLCLLQIVAESALKHEENNVDSTRTYDLYRYTFIEAVSLIYKRYFGKEPTMYRDGPWCQFLSRVLTIWDKKETTPDGAYKAWLEVNKMLTEA